MEGDSYMEKIKHLEYFEKIIIDNGIIMTPQRRAILDVLFTNRKRHLTVEEIWHQAKNIFSQIGIPTVYRTVNQLESIGILYKIMVQGNCCKYQLTDHEEKNKHRHFICTRCGSITDIYLPEMSMTEQQIENRYHVKIENQNIIYYGLCTQCIQVSEE